MAFVLVHADHGIFLGHCLGMTFWSKLDPVGQACAPTFPTREDVAEALTSWLSPLEGKEALRAHEVVPDIGSCASVAACAAAGLEPWQDDVTPVANERPC